MTKDLSVMTNGLSFLKDFDKTSQAEGVSVESGAPKFWIDTGNFVINKIISDSYRGGLAQGRLAMVAGPSGAGKSFIAGNCIKSALKNDVGVLVIDSENALDEGFLTKIGADVHDNPLFHYRGLNTINQCVDQISKFTKSYRKASETHPFLIVVDSLDYLQTDSEVKAYEGGEIKGDQGQLVKQLKKMVGALMHDIKPLNVAVLCTKHVYKEQDAIKALNEPYVVNDAVKFAFSQVLLVTKLMLKDKTTKKYEGIVLKAIGHKTRFAKPFQQARLEVPYDEGMDPFSGLLEVATAMGVLEKNGGWYHYKDEKFQESKFNQYQESILEDLIANEKEAVNVIIEEDDDTSDNINSVQIKKDKLKKGKE